MEKGGYSPFFCNYFLLMLIKTATNKLKIITNNNFHSHQTRYSKNTSQAAL